MKNYSLIEFSQRERKICKCEQKQTSVVYLVLGERVYKSAFAPQFFKEKMVNRIGLTVKENRELFEKRSTTCRTELVKFLCENLFSFNFFAFMERKWTCMFNWPRIQER